ncbi:MAG: hypothetical protein MHPDNHAH_01076 [Anaerolineales bacterium]|nr:hypothetical protein [Anaerolineales bacterium]
MNLKISRFLVIGLIVMGVILNSCGIKQNQPIASQPTLILAISTPISVTLSSTVVPSLAPTDWLSALLTTTPTMYPLPTLPPNCGTVKIGQAGTQTIDNPQKILIQGTAILCGQIYFSPVAPPKTISVIEGMIDLDTGKIDLASADIEFCPGGGSMIFYYFCDINNALVKEFNLLPQDPEQPSFEDCSSVTNPYSRTNDNEPKYACVITNSGNISRVKIEQYNPMENVMSLEISFVTWGK